MVKVPTGGRKKKLNAPVATTAVVTATQSRPRVATIRITSRNESDTVAAFSLGSHFR